MALVLSFSQDKARPAAAVGKIILGLGFSCFSLILF